MRRLWCLWRDRRIVHGRYYDITIKRWWCPSDRRSARAASLLCDFTFEKVWGEARAMLRDDLLYGHSFIRTSLVPDDWPYPDEDPPDPL